MTDKIGKKKKIGTVQSTERTTEVESTGAVSGVDAVKPTSGVGAVGKAQGIGKRGPTRIMSMAERAELMRLVEEEAEKMFPGASMNPERKRAVVEAVKMAVDSGIAPEVEE